MRFLTLRSAALAALAAFLLALSSQIAFAQDDATGALSPEGQSIAASINSVRAQNGLPGLRVNALLNQAAQNHVDDLIANGMYGHYGSDGSNVRTRVLRTGYPSGLVSENWVTSASPDSGMSWWMNDWIHRVNILDASWDEVGIGAGKVGNGFWIFVTDFANSDGQDAQIVASAGGEASAAGPVATSVPAEGLDYTIQGGDTLLGIGLRYGIEWQDIALANSMGESELLQIGRVIHIPGIALADPSSVASGGIEYTVSSGDTLIGIAEHYGIDWNDIATANRLGEYTILQIGMQLRLPGVEEDAPAEKESEPEADASVDDHAPSPETLVITTKLMNPVPSSGSTSGRNIPTSFKVTPTGSSEPVGQNYTVKSGDTLYSIAVHFGMGWKQLAASNGLAEDALLQIGQALVIPESAANSATASNTPAAAAPTTPQTVEVQPGDTVIRIAVRHGVDWKELLAVNGLGDDSILQPGQELVLP